MRKLLTQIKKSWMAYVDRRPFLLNHKVNLTCDCRCLSCDSWRVGEDPNRLLTCEQIVGLLNQAHAAGFMRYAVWGGEPLLRQDLPEILSVAKSLGMFTTLSTNGSKLEARARELLPCTDLFVVALDGVGATHDLQRSVDGLFDKVIEGIQRIRKSGGRVKIFFNINLNTYTQVESAAALARDLGSTIYFFPMLRFPGYNDGLVLPRSLEREVFQSICQLKEARYPISNIVAYLRLIRDGRKTACHFPRYHVYVDYDGTCYTCDLGPHRRLATWGNLRHVNLADLIATKDYRQKVREMRTCNACRLACAESGFGSPWWALPVRYLRQKIISRDCAI